MERGVRIFLQTAAIVLSLAICVQAQPTFVTEVPSGSDNFESIGELVYFTVGSALWRTDGTAEGTFELKTGFTGFSEFTEFNGKLIFRSGKIPQEGRVAWSELWTSDGTPSGTVLLKRSSNYDLNIGPATNTYLFFQASDAATGRELYRSNGTVAGTALVKDILPGAGNGLGGISTAARVGNLLFFAGNDGTSGTELWKTDGTSSGTVMIKDVNPGAGNGMDGGVFSLNNVFYFRGNNGQNGWEPWISNGSAAGTSMLKDVVAGAESSGAIRYEIANNGSVYFLVWPGPNDQSTAPDLWTSSGTSASTLKVRTLDHAEYTDEYYGFLTYQDKVYFIQRYGNFSHVFWKSDGTAEGTYSFHTMEDTWDDGITFFDVVKDHLLFTGISQGYPSPLRRHNGTVTEIFYRFKSGGFTGGGRYITAPHIEKSGDLAFFADHEGSTNDGGTPSTEEDYFHLYQTDGLTALSMRELFGVNITGVKEISDFNGKVIFTTHDDYYSPVENFQKLWIYDPAAPSNTAAGKLSVETWNGISGTHVSSIPVDTPPSSTSEISIFETPKNIGDNYGSRVRGYVIPPATGNYTFWIASDDRSELWLSTDDNPGNKRKIAEVAGWTTSRQWDKYTSQKSAPVSLVAGRKYYVEALLKEGTGGDHLAVGWQLPDGTLERPIPGNRLMAFSASVDTSPKVAISYPHDGQEFTAPADVVISAEAYDTDGSITKVEFYNGAAKLGEDASSPYSFAWNDVPIGNYTITAKAIDNDGNTDTHSVDISVLRRPACEGAGRVRQEVWTNVPGIRVSDIPVHTEPDFTQESFFFEFPVAPVGDNYGSRVRGYICPPASGDYTFWIAGDDHVELSLSTDDNPANKRRIAYHTGWTNKREWTKYATQQSAAITLQANRRYYIEALMKEGSSRDHLSVGWQLPNGTLNRPIAGTHFVPFAASPPPPPACAGTGTISVETWTGIDGTRVSSIPVDSPPNLTGEQNIFEAPTNIGSNFGSRFRGYICVPASGNYTFWIASDDHSELWLSSDNDPANKRRIAYHTGWTSPRQWTKYTTQQSTPIPLEAGQQYYIEALYKEDEGGDNMAVGWRLPDGTMERPIPGNRLSPFNDASSATAARMTTEEELYAQINVYPNPAKSGDPQLTISGYEGIKKTIETQIEILNMTGEVVFGDRISCGGDCGSYLVNVNKQLVPGIYLVRMKTNGVSSVKRLLVK